MSPKDIDRYDSANQPTKFADDENLRSLVDNWHHYRNHFAVFLGAGASVGVVNSKGNKMPTAIELRNDLWREFMLSPLERETYDFTKLGLVTLDHAAAIIESKVGRKSIVDWIDAAFQTNEKPRAHRALGHLNPTAIYTTNYDCLVENSWHQEAFDKQLVPVFNANTVPSQGCTPLFKPHGSAGRAGSPVGDGGAVITQFDFFKMQNQHGTMLRNFLLGLQLKCVIFVGYSFQDLDIASRLFDMRQGVCDRHWYAVFPRNDPNVRSMYSQHYKIKQIARTFESFIDDLDKEVDFLPPELKRPS